MNINKIKKLVNSYVDTLNKEELSEKEIVVVMSQLLITIGKSIYDPENKLGTKIDWNELNKKYYTEDGNNIGLGLLLNGGELMSTVSISTIDEEGKSK